MSATEQRITVSWRRERAMLDQASRQYAPMRSNRLMTILIAAAAILVLFASLASGDSVFIAIGLMVGAVFSGMLARRERLQWVNLMADGERTVMVFADEAVRIDGVILNEIPWRMIGRWRKTDHFLLLDYLPVRAVRPGGSMAAPLAAFSPEELSAVEQLLERRIDAQGVSRSSD